MESVWILVLWSMLFAGNIVPIPTVMAEYSEPIRRTVALVPSEHLKGDMARRIEDQWVDVANGESWNPSMPLSARAPAIAHCAGSMLDATRILTARHCVCQLAYDGFVVAAGYTGRRDRTALEIAKVDELWMSKDSEIKDDWAILGVRWEGTAPALVEIKSTEDFGSSVGPVFMVQTALMAPLSFSYGHVEKCKSGLCDHDLALYHHSSGSPLYDFYGRLVGVQRGTAGSAAMPTAQDMDDDGSVEVGLKPSFEFSGIMIPADSIPLDEILQTPPKKSDGWLYFDHLTKSPYKARRQCYDVHFEKLRAYLVSTLEEIGRRIQALEILH